MSHPTDAGGYEAIEVNMLEADVFSQAFHSPPKLACDIVRVVVSPDLLSLGGYGGYLAASAFEEFNRAYQDKTLLWFQNCYTQGVPLWEVEGATDFTRSLLFSSPKTMIRLLIDEEKFVEGEDAVAFLPGFGLLHTLFAAFPEEIQQGFEDDEAVWSTDLARHILGWLIGIRVSPFDTLESYREQYDREKKGWSVQH